jgi:Mce-associated membrane protein
MSVMEDDARRDEPTRKMLVPVLIAALVGALAAAGVFGTLYLTGDVSGAQVGEVLAGASPEVEDLAGRVANLLLNYDSTNLDEVSSQMLDIATGNFREQYEEVLAGGAGLGAALEEASASSRGQILDGPDVYFKSADEAIAIMRVTQTAQSNSNPGGSTIDYVLKVTMIDTSDGGWKADRVEVLSTQQT